MRITQVLYPNRHLPCPKSRKPETARKKVLVYGPVNFPILGYLWLCKMLDRATFPLDDPIILTAGMSDRETNTTCRLTLNWATFNWHVCWVYYPNEAKWKFPRSIEERNKEMIKAADFLVAFTDGKGSKVERLIEQAREAGLKVKIFRY